MSNNGNSGTNAMSFFWVGLALVFITLKLTGVISWSWWVVTMPLWGGLALVLALLLVGGGFIVISELLRGKKSR